jgi:hypothetical protein
LIKVFESESGGVKNGRDNGAVRLFVIAFTTMDRQCSLREFVFRRGIVRSHAV